MDAASTPAATPAAPTRRLPPAAPILGLAACVVAMLVLADRIAERMTFGDLTRTDVRGALIGLTLGRSALEAHEAREQGRSVPPPAFITVPQLRGLAGRDINLPVEQTEARVRGDAGDAGTAAPDRLLLVRGLTHDDCAALNRRLNATDAIVRASRTAAGEIHVSAQTVDAVSCFAIDGDHVAYALLDAR